MALIWDYFARRMAPLLDKALYYVCFVRKQQSGGDLAWKLGIGINDLWMCNPHISAIETVWGGEVLLVPQRLFRPKLPWVDVSHDFTLAHWPRRVEDFPTFPRKDDYLDRSWEPPVPQNLKAITGTGGREAMWGRFTYVDDTSGDKDGIRITDKWESLNIGKVDVPGLKGILIPAKTVVHSKGGMHFNKKCHKQLQGLWGDWVRYGLTRHILTFDGSFNPRYMRDASHTRDHLSNHAWGTAFDINAEWNRLKHAPAKLGKKGSVMDMVEIANKWGFFWGGHFGSKRWDGMHFEVAKIL